VILRAAGADTGAHAGLALVTRGERGQRPVLEHLWPIFGADHLWLLRALEASNNANVLAPGVDLYVENPPKTGRTSKLKGDRRGHTTWRGMGRRKGMVEGVWFAATRRCAITIEQSEWTSQFPEIKKKKVGDGTHRVLEATMLVQGAGAALKEVRESCRVDCAEAVLIAAAGVMLQSKLVRAR
jgi:hypothetical protein